MNTPYGACIPAVGVPPSDTSFGKNSPSMAVVLAGPRCSGSIRAPYFGVVSKECHSFGFLLARVRGCPSCRRPTLLTVEKLIAAVVPRTVTPQPDPAPVAILPPVRRTRPGVGAVAIAVGRADRSGRVRVASLLRALGWLPGTGLDLDICDGTIVARVGHEERHKFGPHGEIGLPASIRALTGIAAGAPVFVAAFVHRGILVIHPVHAVTHALRRTYIRLIGDLDAC